jgi:hypothetical protein
MNDSAGQRHRAGTQITKVSQPVASADAAQRCSSIHQRPRGPSVD